MKVLMFGWEYPPHVYGGLATANFGISEGLHAQGDIETVYLLCNCIGVPCCVSLTISDHQTILLRLWHDHYR